MNWSLRKYSLCKNLFDIVMNLLFLQIYCHVNLSSIIRSNFVLRNYSYFCYLLSYPFIKPIASPAERPPASGIPKVDMSPVWVILSKEEATELKINVDEASIFSISTEITCYCWRYNNKAITPPATNMIILIIFFRKYPTTMPAKKPPPTDAIVGIKLSAFIVKNYFNK